MRTVVRLKKLLILLFIALLSVSYGSGDFNHAFAAEEEELVLLTWSEYINPEIIQAFEDTFHAQVKELYYETEETMDEIVMETDSKGFDVIVVSGITAENYIRQNWLVPVSSKDIPNMKHIAPQWLEARPAIEKYAVPYLWGTVGIAYRQDLVPEKVTGWQQLYQPAEALRGKILMIEDAYDTIGVALKSLGYSLNSKDPQHYDEVEQLLLAQKPYVQAYGYPVLSEESTLVTGDIWMAPMYNGDALVLQGHQPDIVFVVPQEGTNLWIDYLVVTQASEHKQLALEFINFLHEPHNAARLAEYAMFATSNKAAEQLLPPEYLQNPLIYPDTATLEKSESYQALPPRIVKKINTIFSNVLQ